MASDAFTDFIHLAVGVMLVLVHHGDVAGCGFYLRAEKGYDGLGGIVIHIGLIKSVKRLHLRSGCDVDVAQMLTSKKTFRHCFVTLEEFTDQFLRILVRMIFRLGAVMTVADECL